MALLPQGGARGENSCDGKCGVGRNRDKSQNNGIVSGEESGGEGELALRARGRRVWVTQKSSEPRAGVMQGKRVSSSCQSDKAAGRVGCLDLRACGFVG